MSAIETFIEVAECAFWRGAKEREMRKTQKPGESYANLPPEVREKLANMKSDDFKNVRFDAIAWMFPP